MTRLKLRDDAFYAPTGDGICIFTNTGKVVLTGPSVFQWIDRLAPYLDGRYTLAELTASLPAGRRQMTERVVTALRDQRVVVEVGDDEDHSRSDAGRHLVVLVGSGRVLVETVAAVLCSGSRSVRLGVTGAGTDMTLLAECERRARQRDADQRITHVTAELSDEERTADVVAGAGLVVYAADRAAVDEVRALDRVCTRAGIPFVAAILAGEEAWVGPFGSVAGQRPGWMSAWRRLLALGSRDDTAHDHVSPDHVSHDHVSPDHPDTVAATVVANQLVREAVRLLSGTVEPTAQPRMMRIDLHGLGTRRHGFLPHPFALPAPCPDRADAQDTIRRLRDGATVDPEDFSRRVVACLQARIGVLGEVTEQDFTQLPLAVSQVRVSDPVLLLGPRVPLPVSTGTGPSLADARRAAVLHGLVTYGTLMVDPRRLHTTDGTVRAVWGERLDDGLPHEVPATVAFPALLGIGATYAPPAGAAAGYDWAQAVRAGLVGQCRRLTLTEVAGCRRPFTPIDWEQVALDEPGDRYRSMCRISGERLDVYDVTGSPGVPTLAFCVGDVTVAYASGLSFPAALRDGLAEVLLSYQARVDDGAAYAPARVPPLPPGGRGSGVTACPQWSTDEATVTARLARLGWSAVAVPLDHDPGVAAILPYLVTVVLIRA